jgi:hypothetical protein
LLLGLGDLGARAAVGRPTFLSPQASPIAVAGGRVFVANTPADTVDKLSAESLETVGRVVLRAAWSLPTR